MAIDISFLQTNQTLIPFLFVLAIVFGVLEVTNILRSRGANFLVSVAIAFFTISNASFVAFLWSQFGNITAFFIVMFFIAFVLEIFGLRRGGGSSSDAIIINGAILFILLSIGFLFIDLIPPFPVIGGGSNLFLLFAIVFILVIFWATFKAGAPSHPQR